MKTIRNIIILAALAVVFFAVRYYVYEVSYRLSYRDIIEKNAETYSIDEYLMMAMIKNESNFDKKAVSKAGAKGLMQLTETTAQWIADSMGDTDFKIEDLYNPETNIKMGAWYIDNLRHEFGTTELILAAYNAGQGHVNEWLSDSVISAGGKDYNNIPYGETRNYVKNVLQDMKIYEFLY